MTVFKQIPSISSLVFFDVTVACCHIGQSKLIVHNKFKLPDLASYLDEDEFAHVYAAWHEDKMHFHVEVDGPFEKGDFNDFHKADSVEIFIDTRNLKQKTTLGRFCHHFVFFPEKVEGAYGHEFTRFRGDDVHTLCKPTELQVESIVRPNSTTLDIVIPASCMHGYSPKEFPKIGFSYRINKKDAEPQHFSNTSKEVQFEKNPSLWATLECKK